MTAVCIIVGLVLIINIVLLLPVSLNAGIGEKSYCILEILFFKIDLLKKRDKPQKKKSSKKSSEKSSGKKQKKSKKKKQSIKALIDTYKDLALELLSHTNRFFKRIVIKQLHFNLTVAADDAAATAIEYGAFCSAVYPALSATEKIFTLKQSDVNVKPDFDGTKTTLSLKTQVYFRPLFTVTTLIAVAVTYIKFKLKSNKG